MDIADSAEYQEQLARDFALAYRKKMIQPTGKCANCATPTGGVFCCVDCRDDWQKRQDANQRNGL